MKILYSVLAFTAFAVAGNAAAQGFYAGASLGYVDLGEDVEDIQAEFDEDDFFSDTSITADIEDTGPGWKLFGGYMFTEYLGVEGAYVDLGKASLDADATTTIPDLSSEPIDFTTSLDGEISGFTVAGIGRYPLNDRFDVFAKAGAYFWNAKTTGSVRFAGFVTERVDEEDDGSDFIFGLGGRYHLTETVSLRAEWEHFFAEDGDANLLSLGFEYNF